MSHYRDPLAGLKSQIATKRAVLESRERELSLVLRALLPASFDRTVADLRPRTLADGDSMEQLAAVETALDGLLAAYDEAERSAPALRECADELRDPGRPAMPPPWLFEEPHLEVLRDAARTRIARIRPDAFLSRYGDYAYIARFAIGAAPYIFVMTAHPLPNDARVARCELSLRTSVPRGLAALVVRREKAHHAVARALHLAHEIEIGVPVFDAGFWITGSEATAAVLTPDVRRALEGVGDRAPVLSIAEGVATISWTGNHRQTLKDVIPHAALCVLSGLRVAIETG